MTKKSFSESLTELIEKHFGGSSKESQETQENIAKAVNVEKQVFTAVVLRPDVVDAHGDIYDAETVEDACHSYNSFCRKANLQHLVQTELATPVESYIAKHDFTLGDGEVYKGDWVLSMKIHDKELWEMCKKGTFTAFSVGCLAKTEDINDGES